MLGQNAKQNEEQKISGSEASCFHGCCFARGMIPDASTCPRYDNRGQQYESCWIKQGMEEQEWNRGSRKNRRNPRSSAIYRSDST